MFLRLLIVLLALLVIGGRTEAQQSVSFAPASQAARPGAVVPESMPAILRWPHGTTTNVPAVVIVHASAGLMPNGPEHRYAAALNDAGIATLVIDMWTARGIPAGPEAFGGTGGVDRRPKLPSDTLPDAFGALKFLAAQSGIDRGRMESLDSPGVPQSACLPQSKPTRSVRSDPTCVSRRTPLITRCAGLI